MFSKYVKLILQEYNETISEKIKVKLININDFNDYIKIEDTGTITLFANLINSTIYLPLNAYNTIENLSHNEKFRTNKNHKTYNSSNMIINNDNFRAFDEHIILTFATSKEYFEKILLHENMHICGSDGGNALSEGFTELKTREMAQKYGLKTFCCGYPKETKIAYELQNICDKLAFSDLNTRLRILKNKYGENAAKLYILVIMSMEQQFRPYMSQTYFGINGVNKKCDEYDRIDYIEAYNYLNQYKKSLNVNSFQTSKRNK